MISLPNYRLIDIIYESDSSLVYRGVQKQDELPVIIKILRKDYPSPAELNRYRQEYEITHHLDLEGVIKAYSWEKYQNTLIIIFEDFGGTAFKTLMKTKKFSLLEFLQISLKIAKSLGSLHANQIIHKDINPSNIVYNPENGQLKIIDFGIATQLSQENTRLKNPNLLEGTLAYISPEQTGRMNRLLDYRTDFYSLGVTFYEFLTGKLPFEATDALELVHCHMAKQPLSPHQINSKIPKVISDIVMKTMAKTAEKRYQSAWGIQSDLETCLTQLQETGKISEFTLAVQDISDQFQIPQKLYGREKEIKILLTAFEKVCYQKENQQPANPIEMMLVTGYSGIGKTSLVRELYKPITQKRGYFISGKFEQLQRHIPYYAVVNALVELVQQVLMENQDKLKQWQNQLLQSLGTNGQVIIDIIPELELIIGQQPPVTKVLPIESENRLRLVFKNFIRAFCRPEHPLVIFLDDLQWADSASLNLIEIMMTDEHLSYLLIIGAYRDNEVNPHHPLMITLDKLHKQGASLNYISLNNLFLSDIKQLISDALNNSSHAVNALAKLVLSKTNGNPFFINEFLKKLVNDKLIYFNFDKKQWKWSISQIKTKKITDNVAELLVDKFKKLPESTQQIIRYAACIGSEFDLNTLSIISEQAVSDISLDLTKAIQSGLILPISALNQDYSRKTYRFQHDQIQQAAYSLIEKTSQEEFHLKIGSLLIQRSKKENLSENIFKIVDHFNLSINLIKNQKLQDEVVQLNWQAGQKAKDSAAYKIALEYFSIALNLLNKNNWQTQYDLTLNIYEETAEMAYLSGQFDLMNNLISTIFKKTKTVLDKVKAYEIKIQAYMAKNEQKKALQTGLEILKLLNINFPENPNSVDIQKAIKTIKYNLANQPIEELIHLPFIKDPQQLAIANILMSLSAPAYNAAPSLLPLLIAKLMDLSLKYGQTTRHPFAYAMYGLVLCGVIEDIETGYQFGELALNLIDKFKVECGTRSAPQSITARTYNIVCIFTKPWREHMESGLSILLEGYIKGVETGDYEFAAYCAHAYCVHGYYIGKNLTEVEQESKKYAQAIAQLKQETALNYHQLCSQSVLNLIIYYDEPWKLKGEIYDEDIRISPFQDSTNKTANFIFYIHKLILSYLFHNYEQAIYNLTEAENNLDGGRGLPMIPIFYLYNSLTWLAIYKSSDQARQQTILKKVKNNQDKLKNYAYYSPQNWLHKFYLVEAERLQAIGQNFKAMEAYDKSIDLAQKNGYLNEEALAYELAAKFYLFKGNEKVAKTYLQEARYCYVQWGANAKVKHLDKTYSQLFSLLSPKSINISSPTTSTETHQDSLELATLIKTSKAISQEKNLAQLLEILMNFLLENSGAQSVVLLLEKLGKLFIEAEGTTEGFITVLKSLPVEHNTKVLQKLINYVQRTQESVILNQGSDILKYISANIDLSTQQVPYPNQSILCSPILSQGRVIGVLYLENDLANDIFNEDRLEVVKLISSQAAIAIENAILRQQESQVNYEYQVGGGLSETSPTYVVRSADRELYQRLKLGDFCYVLNSRQMGKTSLRVQMMRKLEAEGYACATIDLTAIGSQNITIEQWYAGLIYELVKQFNLSEKFNLRTWWRSLELLSPVQRFTQFIQEVILKEVTEEIVIFIDEIDSILSLNIPMDDFFAVIRSCYNSRANQPAFQRLTFVLLGVASPSQLIQDKTRTPFNIGRGIRLTGFHKNEVQPLTKGLAAISDNPQALVEEVLHWTGGQPFLTQKLCCILLRVGTFINLGQETEQVERVVKTQIVENWEVKDEPEHLKTIRTRLLRNFAYKRRLLEIYQQILQQGEVMTDASPEQVELILSGLVKKEEGKLMVFNPIYQMVFNLDWVAKQINS